MLRLEKDKQAELEKEENERDNWRNLG